MAATCGSSERKGWGAWCEWFVTCFGYLTSRSEFHVEWVFGHRKRGEILEVTF